MSDRQRRRREWDRDVSIANTVSGFLLGALLGGTLGLGICVWVIPFTLLFPGDTILTGAVVCGIGGYWYGDPFIEWLRESWETLL